MTHSDVQKIRTAVAVLRGYAENEVADGLLDVVEPIIAREAQGSPPKRFEIPGGHGGPCPHAYIASRSGVAVAGTEAVCACCGTIVGTFRPAEDGETLFVSTEPTP